MHAGRGDAGLNGRRLRYAQVSGTRTASARVSYTCPFYPFIHVLLLTADRVLHTAYHSACAWPTLCILLCGSPEAKAAILKQATMAARNGGHLTSHDELSFLTLEELKSTGDRYTETELNALAKRMTGKSTYVPPCDHSITTAGMRAHACLRSICMRLFPTDCAYVGYVEDDKLAAIHPVERVEAYHEDSPLAWAHADH